METEDGSSKLSPASPAEGQQELIVMLDRTLAFE
jgi:hypothetical protein